MGPFHLWVREKINQKQPLNKVLANWIHIYIKNDNT